MAALAAPWPAVPPLIAHAGQKARKRFWAFFLAAIRNANTRRAYAQAFTRFGAWCERRGLALADLEPVVIAAYIEDLGRTMSPASVRQQLAALNRLFAWLVGGQVIETNPAREVRGPDNDTGGPVDRV